MGFRGTLSTMSPRSFTYDPNAYAVITAIQSTGVSLTTSQELSCNNLIKRFKAANIWTKQKALYGVLGGTAAAHKWNWVNPLDTNGAFRLTFTAGWVHSNMGMLPNGSSDYADTKLVPNTALTLYNNHISFYSRTNTNVGGGNDIGGQWQQVSPQLSGLLYQFNGRNSDGNAVGAISTNDPYRVIYTQTQPASFVVTSRVANNSLKSYTNGVLKGTNTTVNSSIYNVLPRNNAYISAFNYFDGVSTSILSYSNKQCAFASIGDGLTDTEVSDQFNIVEQYQIDNSRGTVVGFVPTTKYDSGTTQSYNQPFTGLYNYSISASIYLQSELGALPKKLKSIQLYFSQFTTPASLINQEIWIANVVQSSFGSATPAVDFSDLTLTNLTKVKNAFTHTVTSNNQWYQFNFDTTFTYNGTSNIIVIWKNYDGSGSSAAYGASYTTSATNRGMYKFNDPSFPTGNGTRTSNVSSVRFLWDFVD